MKYETNKLIIDDYTRCLLKYMLEYKLLMIAFNDDLVEIGLNDDVQIRVEDIKKPSLFRRFIRYFSCCCVVA